jgi:hypothetical protein
MDAWELDFHWLKVQHYVKESFDRKDLPDLSSILFLIGVQELGIFAHKFSKEEKQDIIHIAVCKLLSFDGYYTFSGRDQDGWPHYELIQPFQIKAGPEQERLLKQKVVQYFNILEKEYENV